MYSNNNMIQASENYPIFYQDFNNSYNGMNNRGIQDERLIGGGFLAPFLLGGIAGYAFGRPNYYQYPYNYSYNNFYYPYYQPFYY